MIAEENRSIDDLCTDIASARDDMFKLNRYKQSKYLKGFYVYDEILKGPIFSSYIDKVNSPYDMLYIRYTTM